MGTGTKNTIRSNRTAFLKTGKGVLFFLWMMSGVTLWGQETVGPVLHDTIVFTHGEVTDHLTGRYMFHVHIINLSRNRAALSDRKGQFSLQVKAGDTIYFSHVGYKKRLVTVPDALHDTGFVFRVSMVQDTVILKQFRVLAASRQVQFKHDFITRQVIPDTLNPAFEAFVQENHFHAPTGSIVLPGPFTLIYENFNKSARLQRRIERNRTRYYDNLPEEEKRKVLFHDEE
jgi:hypothetical protein